MGKSYIVKRERKGGQGRQLFGGLSLHSLDVELRCYKSQEFAITAIVFMADVCVLKYGVIRR